MRSEICFSIVLKVQSSVDVQSAWVAPLGMLMWPSPVPPIKMTSGSFVEMTLSADSKLLSGVSVRRSAEVDFEGFLDRRWCIASVVKSSMASGVHFHAHTQHADTVGELLCLRICCHAPLFTLHWLRENLSDSVVALPRYRGAHTLSSWELLCQHLPWQSPKKPSSEKLI